MCGCPAEPQEEQTAPHYHFEVSLNTDTFKQDNIKGAVRKIWALVDTPNKGE